MSKLQRGETEKLLATGSFTKWPQWPTATGEPVQSWDQDHLQASHTGTGAKRLGWSATAFPGL